MKKDETEGELKMEGLDIQAALVQGFAAVQSGREVLLNYFGQLSQIKEKYQAGLVSEADVESEKAIVNSLLGRFPHHHIIGEEQSFQAPNQSPDEISADTPTWIIDPLDGTTNYIYNFHVFCISVGLHFRGEVVLGLVDVPKLNQTYFATKGGGAWVRENGLDRQLKVSHRNQLNQALLATGFSAYDEKVLRDQLNIFSELLRKTRGIRRAGSAAYDLCQVAEGVFDGFWEKNLSPWDTAAGVILVREAGGLVTDYRGEHFKVEMKSLLAANPKIHSSLTPILTPAN